MREPLLYMGLAVSALLPAVYVYVARSSPQGAWRRLRMLMLSSVTALMLLTGGVGDFDETTLSLAFPALAGAYMVLNYHFERRTVDNLLYGIHGRVHRVSILSSPIPTAFTVAITGRVYATTGLYQRLAPEEAAAIVAHEVGHLEALRPVPSTVFVVVVAVAASALVTGVADLLQQGPVGVALAAAVLLAAGASWVQFSWAWEHLADIYALEAAGAWSISALYRITGAGPEKPRLARAYLDTLRCLRPRGGRGVAFLVNPHPRPGYRLYLLEKLAWRTGSWG